MGLGWNRGAGLVLPAFASGPRTGLSGRGGVRATAQLVLMEGARTGLPLVFIVVMLVVLPLIPLSLDPDAPLRYRVQTFMSWSLGLAFWLAALMTLLLGCSTIATEIRDRQIWQVVTKPISRLRWLVGKWLGLAVLNFVLTATSCVSIFFFIQYLRSQPTAEGLAGREDSFLLQETVLTARAGAFPTWDELDNEQLRQRISQIEETDPEIRARGGMGINERRAAVQELRELHNSLRRTVPQRSRRAAQLLCVQWSFRRQRSWWHPDHSFDLPHLARRRTRAVPVPLHLRPAAESSRLRWTKPSFPP